MVINHLLTGVILQVPPPSRPVFDVPHLVPPRVVDKALRVYSTPDDRSNLGVSNNRGTPKWMVYNGKPYKNG